MMDEATKVKVLEIDDSVELSLRLMLGFSTKGTMKLKGEIEGKVVTMLIASGTTHNFIHQNIMEELTLPLLETTNYGLVVGNGTEIHGKGYVRR